MITLKLASHTLKCHIRVVTSKNISRRLAGPCTTLIALPWRLLTFSSVSWRRLTAPRLFRPMDQTSISRGFLAALYSSAAKQQYFVPIPDIVKRELEQLRAANTAKDAEILAKDREILALKARLAKYEDLDNNNN